MRTKIIFTLLAIFFSIQTYSTPIPLSGSWPFQHGRPRMPSATSIIADIESSTLTIDVSAYTGPLIVNIYDNDGNEVASSYYSVKESGRFYMALENLYSNEEYSISIKLNDITYHGTFEL